MIDFKNTFSDSEFSCLTREEKRNLVRVTNSTGRARYIRKEDALKNNGTTKTKVMINNSLWIIKR